MGNGPEPAPLPAVGVKRVLFVVAGLGFVGMAYLGAVLPGLPTTPWVLAASYCFGRSSPRLQRWLYRTPYFGRLLRDWQDHRGMRRPMKGMACAMVVAACTFSVGFAGLPDWLRWVIGGCGAVGLGVILFAVPTVPAGAGYSSSRTPANRSNVGSASSGGSE